MLMVVVTLLVLCSCKKRSVVYSDLSYYDSDYTPAADNSTGGKENNSSKDGTGNKNNSNSSKGGNTSVVPGTADGEKKTFKDYNGVTLASPITLHTGSKAMDESLNFGGKKLTMAITSEPQYHTDAFSRKVAAFEKKFNCKISLKELEFNKYNQQVTQAMSAGNSYDICFMHGSMFPAAPISNLYNDLTDYFSTADITTKNSDKGIDLVKTSYCVWNGKVTGVCNFSAQYPFVIYYNKVLFKENDLEDPLELYNAGKWTWSKVKSMGKKVTDAANGIYFLSNEFTCGRCAMMCGSSLITVKNGKPVNEYKTEATINGLNLFKSIYTGTAAIGRRSDNSTDKYGDFIKGSVFMTNEESPKYSIIAESASKSTAFNKNKDNVGIVPMPLDNSNKSKAYPCGNMTAVCSGAGSSDPRVAVAWAKFCSTYSDPVTDKFDMSASQKELCNKLLRGNTAFGHGSYASSSTSTLVITSEINNTILNGGDIAQTIENYSAQIEACIKAVVG